MKLKTAKVKVLSTGNAEEYQASVHGERIGPCRKGDIIEVPISKPKQQPTLGGVVIEDLPVLEDFLRHKPKWFKVVDEKEWQQWKKAQEAKRRAAAKEADGADEDADSGTETG